jgi:hypothetical protein
VSTARKKVGQNTWSVYGRTLISKSFFTWYHLPPERWERGGVWHVRWSSIGRVHDVMFEAVFSGYGTSNGGVYENGSCVLHWFVAGRCVIATLDDLTAKPSSRSILAAARKLIGESQREVKPAKTKKGWKA